MPATASLEIPLEVLHATRMRPQELVAELAVVLYEQGKLSLGKARELSGMTVWSFQQMLGLRGIPVHYGVEEYEQDLETLAELDRA